MLYLRDLFADESGAVTVDWTVLTAAVVGLGIASAAAVRTGTGSLGEDIRLSLSRAYVAGSEIYSARFENDASFRQVWWGFVTHGQIDGWTTVDHVTGLEFKKSGVDGLPPTPDGGHMLDMEASPGNVGLGRTLDALTPGETYQVRFNALDQIGTNGVAVYYGGELIGNATPSALRTFETFSFDITAGSGDGSGQLVIQGTGPEDNRGVFLHGLVVH